jgi:hypothetical protein
VEGESEVMVRKKKKKKKKKINWPKKAFDLMHAIPRDEKKNPLTLEGGIRSMILKSPGMVQWRDDALDMMYCTLGAGIGWNDEGRLVDYQLNNYMNPPPEAGGQGIWARDFGMDDSLEFMKADPEMVKRLKDHRQRELDAAIETVRDIDNRCRTYRPGRTRWYPFSWYSCNLCAPDHAQEDFFMGAIEMATLILHTDLDNEYYMQHWGMRHRTLNTAKEILEVLKAKKLSR